MSDVQQEIKPHQSIELLKELHILTRSGKMNQDSRRKLKQIYHLYQFIEPVFQELQFLKKDIVMVDQGAGKSYLGFIIYDLFFKNIEAGELYSVESREALIESCKKIAQKLNFKKMTFLNSTIENSIQDFRVPKEIDVVTALHACDTATDSAIEFAVKKKAKYILFIPCCQAEVASVLKKNKARQLKNPLTEIWRHSIHTREFGSHLTNVFRCLQLESYGYQVTVTEFVGLEHSLKNELILAKKIENKRLRPAERLKTLLEEFELTDLVSRYSTNF